ncbi:MAG TPA: acetate/propionate family kinase [Rhodothermia bacterium]|nr:acetate/propionate family kinase [Rhodothermia bacterium]
MGRGAEQRVIPAEERTILVLNVGSSTLKFGVFPLAGGDDALLHGVLEYSGPTTGQLRITDSKGHTDSKELVVNRDSAPAELLHHLERDSVLASIHCVGHRVVHGGSKLRRPVRINAGVRALLDEVIPLAPDHLPAELRAIDEVSRLAPSLVQVACFDTAFHGEIPAAARLFGLPRRLTNSGVVRYGFHGLSYEYVAAELRERGELPARTIVAHLGNGASIAALVDGVSIDTSMGMTPSGGMVMSTRSGDLDPGVLLYLLRSRGFSASELDDAINRGGGMLGISESSSDMRDLLAASPTDSRAEDAIAVFCYQAKKFIGAYAAALGGIDALVFTGGIGERSPEVRARICEKLDFLGIRIDPALNRANASIISPGESRVRIRIVKTKEEAMVARHVRESLPNSPLL